jgi:hypothetical protein
MSTVAESDHPRLGLSLKDDPRAGPENPCRSWLRIRDTQPAELAGPLVHASPPFAPADQLTTLGKSPKEATRLVRGNRTEVGRLCSGYLAVGIDVLQHHLFLFLGSA